MSNQTQAERDARIKAKHEAFVTAVQAVMKAHGATEIKVEMESGGFYEYSGAHMAIEFAYDANSEYTPDFEVGYIEAAK